MKVRTILRKEWAEGFRNRLVLWTFAIVPLLFVVLGLGTTAATSAMVKPEDLASMEKDAEEIRAMAGDICADLGGAACLQVYMATIFLLMFLMLPVLLPAVFASYSVVGEKTSHTLEPLLATPITTWQLLLAKSLAAVIPAVVATWAGVAVYLVGSALLMEPAAFARLIAPVWLLAVGVVGPLLAVFGVLVAMMVSSRTQDARTAQQLSGLVVLPMVMLLMGQSMGLFLVNETLVFVAAGVLVPLDAVLLWLAVQVFDRERILTRWR